MNCRVCNSTELVEILELKNAPESAQLFLNSQEQDYQCSIDLKIKQCSRCGHVQTTNKPVNYYKEVITTAGLSKKIGEERISVINHIISKSHFNKPNILEIGAHKGLMVDLIDKTINCNIVGIESSQSSVLEGKQKDIDLVEGYFGEDTSKIKGKTFDIVVCYNFLEHMPKPKNVLEELKNFLNDNSYVYMTVPSLNFIEKTACVHEFISDHLSYFSELSLKNLFSYCGFEVVQCNSFHNNNDLEILAKFRKIKPLKLNLNQFEELKNNINQLIESKHNKRNPIFIWGAGHRSLTLISQINYSKIDYIIDSANFKQGKYSPVSRIRIESPSFLNNFDNGILIINLPGIYGDEVISSLPKKIKDSFSIFNIVENEIKNIV